MGRPRLGVDNVAARYDRGSRLPVAAGDMSAARDRRAPLGGLPKRVLDVLGALSALVLLGPLMLIVALLVRVALGRQVIFHQRRVGFGGEHFVCFKFRSMVRDADEVLRRHLSANPDAAREWSETQKLKDDPRVGVLGKVLRKTSIDELPQLINVVLGDMSLVGPRPHVPGMKAASVKYEDLVPYYFQRHNIRPGITGLAQVSGCRGSTAMADAAVSRVDYDLQYIERWSLWLDIKIIVRTIRHEFFSGTGI